MLNLKKLVVTTVAEFDALAAPWRLLEQQVPHLLPFQTYDWNRCWWSVFSDSSLFHKDELAICTLYEEDQGQRRLVAVMPLTNTHVGLHSLFIYRYVRPFGADPNLTEIRIPLALPDFNETILQQWEDLSRQETFGLTEFQLIHTRQHAAHFLASNTAVHALDERAIPNYILHLQGDWQNFKSGLKRNIKESLRHCYNSLARDDIKLQHKILRGRDAVKAGLNQFYALHRQRAGARDTVEHPDYFADEKHCHFIAGLLETGFADRVCLFCLELDGKTVALRMGFVMGDELYLYYSGYDLAYSRYSVMTTLLAEIIQWSFAQQIARVNLSVGEDVSKTRWAPDVTDYVEYQCVKNNAWRRKLGQSILDMRKLRKNWSAAKTA
ncbi:GNAT family N-acetyltransferase [Undibacterium sp. TS12]|uniref:GNAT family N-acetyltransferase n=1 Tax=Undibacterium sp. TS12 TaxID=2908202 RepID=UPI001F4D26D2|nr:GNAT family N-acetyltransferase [Undibacterium sp. TS12]MCH8619415.1 GNAT family N-acetyltransferase [Undibacterium sp. TS12]